MELFMKIYGGFLSACFTVFGVLLFLAFLVGALYIILMPWKPLPTVEHIATMDLASKLFISGLGGILLFAILGAIYGILDSYVNPKPGLPFSPPRPITPTGNSKKEDTPRPPILG